MKSHCNKHVENGEIENDTYICFLQVNLLILLKNA